MGTNELTTTSSTGITLSASGPDTSPFTITTTGSISTGQKYGVYSTVFDAFLLNEGSISSATSGVYMTDGGTVTNSGVASVINSPSDGVFIEGYYGTVTNFGTIGSSTLTGVGLDDGGTISNLGSNSAIFGGEFGLIISGGTGVIVNNGTILGTSYDGVAFDNGGSVDNTNIILGGRYGIFGMDGGSITNNGSAAQLIGATDGIAIDGTTGTVTNYGAITGTSQVGVSLEDGGVVSNIGTIVGGTFGVYISSGIDNMLVNKGMISSYTFGVDLSSGISNSLTNAGTIFGGIIGVFIDSGIGNKVINSGTISSNSFAVDFSSGIATDTLVNTGTIFGGENGVYIGSGSYNQLINSGIISTNLFAVDFSSGIADTLVNTGTISGGAIGVYIGSGSDNQLVNSGTISDTSIAVDFETGSDDRLVVNPGAVFEGTVKVSTAAVGDTLEFGAGRGRLTGIGSQFTGFSTLTFDTGAAWFVGGTLSALSAEKIEGFAVHDIIDLTGFTIASTETLALQSNGELSIPQAGSTAGTLDFAGIATGTVFYAISDQTGGTEIFTGSAPCFCAGTRITTPRGQVAVETLKIGDAVKTLHGGVQSIKWIGQRHYDGRFIAGNHHALPIRIRRHALGFNVPSRDLYVSPDHAICEGGMLIHAWRLINGVSITQVDAVDSVSYFHIELEKHDILFANNVPAESFLNENCRDRFQNVAEFMEKFPEAETAQTPCLPRLESGFYLHRIQTRLAARAGVTTQPVAIGPMRGFIDECSATRLRGWAQNICAPEAPVELEILGADGSQIGRILANGYRPDLRAAGLGSGCHGFSVPLPPGLPRGVTVRRIADQQLLPRTEAALAEAA